MPTRRNSGRTKNGKVRTEHAMAPGLEEFLEELSEWAEIKSAVPARLKSTLRGSYPTLHIQSETISGLKCSYKSQGRFQELFLVTSDKAALRQKLLSTRFEHVRVER